MTEPSSRAPSPTPPRFDALALARRVLTEAELAPNDYRLQETARTLRVFRDALLCDAPALLLAHVRWLLHLAGERRPCGQAAGPWLEAVSDEMEQWAEGHGLREQAARLSAAARTLPGAPPSAPESFLAPGHPHGELCRAYLEDLLAARGDAARRRVLAAADEGVPVRELYTDVFAPVQQEVGRLWQLGRASVAQEHYATAITQLLMAQLYPSEAPDRPAGLRIGAMAVAGEQHDMGLRMVADFFEMEGWEVLYFGANTPPDEITVTLGDRPVDLLALSATLGGSLCTLRELIAALRAKLAPAPPVLVGGHVFDRVPDLWRRVGADDHASTPAGALDAVRRLTARP